jgi:hypothetical protein
MVYMLMVISLLRIVPRARKRIIYVYVKYMVPLTQHFRFKKCEEILKSNFNIFLSTKLTFKKISIVIITFLIEK